MKNSYSNIFTFNKKILKKTIKNLNNGSIVGLPTETVYGLGGNAYQKKPILNIFNLKNRPKTNPLIIHYYNQTSALKDVEINKHFKKLYRKFCPGPITFVLKRKISSKIHPLACAGFNTVAIRFPKHKVIRSVLKKIDFPLAMPSANKSTNVSPVNSLDVFEEFKKKISIILEGGKCKVGIESTVVDLTNHPVILRPGVINKNELEKTLKLKLKNMKIYQNKKSPGMMRKHYSPGIPVKINQKKHDGTSAYIYIGKKYKHKRDFFNLSENFNLNEASSNLYRIFRLIKKKGFKKIQIDKIPKVGSGIAINDRIKRASES